MKDVFLQADVIFSKFYPDYRKLLKYLSVGLVTTTIDTSIYLLLLSTTRIDYLIVNVISFHSGMVVSYYLNRTFTFRSQYEKVHFQLASFAIVAYLQLLLGEAILFILVDLVFKNDALTYTLIAKGAAIAVGFVFAYVTNKKLTFKIFN